MAELGIGRRTALVGCFAVTYIRVAFVADAIGSEAMRTDIGEWGLFWFNAAGLLGDSYWSNKVVCAWHEAHLCVPERPEHQ